MLNIVKKSAAFLLAALMCLPVGNQPVSALEISNNQTIKNPGIYSKNQTIPLLAPTSLTAESTEIGEIVLHWTDNSVGESGFQIERKLSSDDTYFLIDSVGSNVTTYEQSELSNYAVFPGEDYYYRVRSYNSTGSSGYSNEAYVMVKSNVPSPSPPAALRAKAMLVDNNRLTVRLFWGDTANNEDKYVVQRSKAGGGFVVAGELPANSIKFEEPADLERNVKYTYRVIAYNAGGAGVSNTADVNLPACPPAIPIFEQAADITSNSMVLKWKDNSNNEDGFLLTRYGEHPADGNPFVNPDKEYVLAPNTTTFKVTDLKPYTYYGFKLHSYNALNNLGDATLTAVTLPAEPTQLIANVESPTKVKVIWNWSGENMKGFSLERKKAYGVYEEIASVDINSRSYTDLVQPGTGYYYRVRVWYEDGYHNKVYSLFSNEMGVTTPQQSSNLQNPGTTNNTLKVINFTLGQKNYQVNGQTLPMETAPVSLEGRTMLPVKYLSDPLQANLTWNALKQKVTITLNGKEIELFIGKNTALVNGQEILIDPQNPAVVPVVSPEGRTLMPISFISQHLGCQIEWNALTQTASLSYSGK